MHVNKSQKSKPNPKDSAEYAYKPSKLLRTLLFPLAFAKEAAPTYTSNV